MSSLGKHWKKTPEQIERQKLAMIGHKVSRESKKKNSESHKGKLKFNALVRQKGYYSFLERRRKYRKKMAGGSHTFGEWENLKAQYNWTCPCCGKSESEIKLTEDHIIPISKGGSDNIENIQPLCIKCNMSKSTKTIKYELISKSIAQKLI